MVLQFSKYSNFKDPIYIVFYFFTPLLFLIGNVYERSYVARKSRSGMIDTGLKRCFGRKFLHFFQDLVLEVLINS